MGVKTFYVLCASLLFLEYAILIAQNICKIKGVDEVPVFMEGGSLVQHPKYTQSALSKCLAPIGAGVGPYRATLGYEALAYDGLAGYGAWPGRLGCGAPIVPAVDIAAASSLNAAYGGGLPISSASAMPPTGLTVASENAYEGSVAVAGNLPFLGTVSVEGVFPTMGAGAVSYGCGDGVVGITAEGPIGAAIAPALGYKGFPDRLGLGGCGCGAIY